MTTLQPGNAGNTRRLSGTPAPRAPGVCIAGEAGPAHDLPLWGPRIEVDGAALEMHQPGAYSVDISLPRHLITYWLESSQCHRAIDSDRLRNERFAQGSFNVTPAGSRLKAVSEIPACALLFTLDPIFIQRMAPEHIAEQSRQLHSLQGATVPAMQHLARLAYDMLSCSDIPDRLYLESIMMLVLMEVLGQMRSPDIRESSRSSDLKSQRRMRQVLDYIADNLGTSLNLPELAAVAHMSMYHFARCFRRTLGQSPHQYVIQERFRKSKMLLGQAQHSIAEVALLCGFSHQAHLSIIFKKLQGVTPGEFRKHRSS